MTQDEIIEMARQAGIPSANVPSLAFGRVETGFELLKAFAKLVADVATAKEREVCASICFQQIARWTDDRARFAAGECSKAIRARGEA